MSCACDRTCTCGACDGIRDRTPLAVENRPGLAAVRYRVGDHARFKASLLASVSRGQPPALRALTVRSDDDFSIGLLDAFASMADVLTFYQERIANESFLRTARERLSIGHIARLVGYELGPGSAARTALAFTMVEGAGAVESLRVPVGTRVQSTPGPGEKPQAFETVEEIEARPAWNRIPARAFVEQTLTPGTASVRLRGTVANLRPGDGLLLAFPNAGANDFTASFRRVRQLDADAQGRWTDVSLTGNLSSAAFDALTPAQTGVFAFRRQAGLFGHNAPDFKTLDESRKVPIGGSDWPLAGVSTFADWLTLDGAYKEAVAGTWAVWERPGASGSPMVFRVGGAQEQGFSLYALTGKATQLGVQRGRGVTTSIVPTSFAQVRSTAVHLQAEKLALAETPVPWPVGGKTLAFADPVAGLVPGRRAIVAGQRLRAEVLAPVALFLWSPAGLTQQALTAGDRIDLAMFPIPIAEGALTAFVTLREGRIGFAFARPGQVAYRTDEGGVEDVRIATVSADGRSVTLEAPLAWRYEPRTVTLAANVAEATHGESVEETFEGGNAAAAFQRFALQQTPLTWVAAATASGVRSTLRVFVDDVEWHQVPYLHGRGPQERVFVVRRDGEGRTWIQFGDGVTGARLPTGQRNVRARYRRGIGADGILKGGQVNLLLSRPAGLKDAVNPLPSADGKDPEALDDARANAPLTVLTLDRVVSLQDYEDFARAFAGVYKARATWTWFRGTRGVFLTVAGFQGGPVSLGTRETLRAALAACGDPFVPTHVAAHDAATFRTGLRVKIAADHDAAKILAAVEAALRRAFGFAARAFGQRVTLAEVAAAAQAVRGVTAVQVAQLFRTGDADPASGLVAPLPARLPQPGARGLVLPAELLTLDPAPFALLETMP